MERIVNIYIANGAKSLKSQRGRGLYVLEADNIPGYTTEERIELEKTTINGLELTLLEKALLKIHKSYEVRIWTNNNFLASAFRNDWITRWKNNGFLNEKGREIANKSKWESILTSLGERKPEIRLKEHHSYTKWMEEELKD